DTSPVRGAPRGRSCPCDAVTGRRVVNRALIEAMPLANPHRVDTSGDRPHMCDSHISDCDAYRRAEERKRRVSDPLVARRGAAPWLRPAEVDRVPLEGRAHVQRRIALPPSLPYGGSRLDRRTLGREIGGTAPPLLSPHARGTLGPGRAARELARVRHCHQPGCGGAICMIGARTFGRGSRALRFIRKTN